MTLQMRSCFSYHPLSWFENYGEILLLQSVPVLGSCISAIGLYCVAAGYTPDGIKLNPPERIQLALRSLIGLIPVFGLSLIPIDLIGTLVDAVRYTIQEQRRIRLALHIS